MSQVFVDREAQQSTVHVSFMRERTRLSSASDYQLFLESWLFQEVLNTRLFKISVSGLELVGPCTQSHAIVCCYSLSCVCVRVCVCVCVWICTDMSI